MDKVALRVHLGLYHDETAGAVPLAHSRDALPRAWSDVRADDGTVSIVQPLIAPLYGGRSAHEVLSARPKAGIALSRRLVDRLASKQRHRHRPRRAHADSTAAARPGRRSIATGASGCTTASLPARRSRRSVTWRCRHGICRRTATAAARPRRRGSKWSSARPDGLRRPLRQQRWLQELPKSLTKLTWDNAALIAPATAERLIWSAATSSGG